jgi:ribosome-associated protein
MKTITISTEEIELAKLLKFAGLVESGGEAKHSIRERRVRVNGEVTCEVRKKLVSGDIVECNQEKIRVSRES